MEILEISVEDLKPYKNNPRLNDKAIDKVAESIKEFGWKVPVVIDSNNVIVAGHTRLKAARKLGIKKIPCIIADDLTPEQVKAFRLADNKVAELAGWKFDKLQKELEEIEVDMSRFGFEDDEEPIESYEAQEVDSEIEMVTLSFQVHQQQKEFIENAMGEVADQITETFGNTNKNGNAIHEIARQWAALREGR